MVRTVMTVRVHTHAMVMAAHTPHAVALRVGRSRHSEYYYEHHDNGLHNIHKLHSL